MTKHPESAYAALARNMAPAKPRGQVEVEPLLKVVVDKPYSERAGQAEVKKRSGGRCELGGPTCLVWAHDVDHVFGRLGPDPHNPDKLLHLCGFGNKNGGCHEWVSSTTMGRASSIWVLENIVAPPV